MTVETITNRVLGAIRFLDAVTMVPVTRLLSVEGTGVGFFRNRLAVYVLKHVPGLENHQRAFDQPPVTPALNSLSIQIRVRDPKGEYLPRVRSIQLPRDPSPANATQSDSLFQPIDILLYPAPTAKIAPGWAVIRASVTAQATGQPLSGALPVGSRREIHRYSSYSANSELSPTSRFASSNEQSLIHSFVTRSLCSASENPRSDR